MLPRLHCFYLVEIVTRTVSSYQPVSAVIVQLLYRRYSDNFVVNLLGKWKESEYSQSGQLIPVGGLVYYITPPTSLADIVANPFHAAFYLAFMLTACALFSKTWIEVSGSSARDVAKQLKVSYCSLMLCDFKLADGI